MTPHHPHPFLRRSATFLAAVIAIGGAPFVAVALADESAAGDGSAGARPGGGIVADRLVSASRATSLAVPPVPEARREMLAFPDLAPDLAPERAARPVVIETPAVVAEEPEVVAVRMAVATLTDTYAWDERGDRVAALQNVLGVTADGWYGHSTLRAHRSALETAGLPTDALPVPPVPAGPSPSQWAALRECESNGNYSITNPSGKYRGAYQFDRPTWNGVASRHAPRLVGVDPAAASPADQDAMARALYGERGARPWPQCGRHLR
jgi:hypothetical protein